MMKHAGERGEGASALACISRVARDAANDRVVRRFIFHKGQNPSAGRLRRTSRVE